MQKSVRSGYFWMLTWLGGVFQFGVKASFTLTASILSNQQSHRWCIEGCGSGKLTPTETRPLARSSIQFEQQPDYNDNNPRQTTQPTDGFEVYSKTRWPVPVNKECDMAKKSKLFKSKERQQRSELAAFLRQFADRIETGQIIFRRGAEEFALDIPDNLILEVDVESKVKKSKGLKHTLELEIKWFEDDPYKGKLALG